MNLETCISDFLNHLTAERGLSANTVAAYSRDLVQFAKFARSRKPTVHELTEADAAGFVSELNRSGMAGASIARKTAALRTFARYLASEGAITKDFNRFNGRHGDGIEICSHSAKRNCAKSPRRS